MSFIGKMLVVLNVVMSFLFMALAGGVFAVHKTWKEKTAQAMVQVDSEKKRADALQVEKDTAAKTHQEEKETATNRAIKAEADLQNLTQQVAALTQQNNDLQTKTKQFLGVAEAKTAEAGARQDEASLRRVENSKLREQLDAETAANRKYQDTLFARDLEMKELKERFTVALRDTADMRTFLATKGLQFDRDAIRRAQEPAPKVTGIVTDVKKDKTNRPAFVEFSVGSDEGLAVGHEMDVVGSGIGDRKADWLGRIKIIDIRPDSAVGQVILKEANGTMEKGDLVTTQL